MKVKVYVSELAPGQEGAKYRIGKVHDIRTVALAKHGGESVPVVMAVVEIDGRLESIPGSHVVIDDEPVPVKPVAKPVSKQVAKPTSK